MLSSTDALQRLSSAPRRASGLMALLCGPAPFPPPPPLFPLPSLVALRSVSAPCCCCCLRRCADSARARAPPTLAAMTAPRAAGRPGSGTHLAGPARPGQARPGARPWTRMTLLRAAGARAPRAARAQRTGRWCVHARWGSCAVRRAARRLARDACVAVRSACVCVLCGPAGQATRPGHEPGHPAWRAQASTDTVARSPGGVPAMACGEGRPGWRRVRARKLRWGGQAGPSEGAEAAVGWGGGLDGTGMKVRGWSGW
jgi:hypothetical protein